MSCRRRRPRRPNRNRQRRRPDLTSREYLFSLEHVGIKLGLEQIRGLVHALGHPERSYPSVHVAGTNGKGSVAAMVERGARAAGLRTGRYTSPHLVDLEERFAIDGVPIAAAVLDEAADRVRRAAAGLPAPPSFFEATTALALDVFREAGVDLAVLEVGLGGRLDATNVVTAVAGAITAIDFDHEQYLGNTLEAIAAEKSGIIKSGMRLVLADNPPGVDAVVERTCRQVGATLVRAMESTHVQTNVRDGVTEIELSTPHAVYGPLTMSLRGTHQVTNAVTAVRLLEELNGVAGFAIPASAIAVALSEVVWPARLELVSAQDVTLLIDGAHNPAGARALADYVRATYGRRPFVVGAMRDKNIAQMLTAMAAAASGLFFTAAASPRAASAEELLAIAETIAPEIPRTDCASPREAIQRASLAGSPVVVAGSLYLAGEVRRDFS